MRTAPDGSGQSISFNIEKVLMTIAKGPFQYIHQRRAMAHVVKARLSNRVSSEEVRTWYLALLNLEKYLDQLASHRVS